MRKDSQTVSILPDAAIVARVIEHAEAYENARDAALRVRCFSLADAERPPIGPEQEALLDFLVRLPAQTRASLDATYRVGTRRAAEGSDPVDIYRASYDQAMQPHHAEHLAADLVGSWPLSEGLRRGMARLGFAAEVAR